MKTEKLDIPDKIETKKEPVDASGFLSLFKQVNTEQKKPVQEPVENYETPSSSTTKENNRKCPFYKRIEGNHCFYY